MIISNMPPTAATFTLFVNCVPNVSVGTPTQAPFSETVLGNSTHAACRETQPYLNI
jgi:hypothetical protein